MLPNLINTYATADKQHSRAVNYKHMKVALLCSIY